MGRAKIEEMRVGTLDKIPQPTTITHKPKQQKESSIKDKIENIFTSKEEQQRKAKANQSLEPKTEI